jgi:hypothetical protein
MANIRSTSKAEFNLIKEHKAWTEDDWDHHEHLSYSEAPSSITNPFYVVFGEDTLGVKWQ